MYLISLGSALAAVACACYARAAIKHARKTSSAEVLWDIMRDYSRQEMIDARSSLLYRAKCWGDSQRLEDKYGTFCSPEYKEKPENKHHLMHNDRQRLTDHFVRIMAMSKSGMLQEKHLKFAIDVSQARFVWQVLYPMAKAHANSDKSVFHFVEKIYTEDERAKGINPYAKEWHAVTEEDADNASGPATSVK